MLPRRNPRWISILWPPILCCAVLALLPGCEPQDPAALYDNYLARLGRTLSVEVPAVAHPVPPKLAEPGQLRLDIPPDRLDTLDFLALSGCAVQATIIKRNSSLGRMARDAQRLLVELEYLRLAPPCITRLRDNDKNALAELLEQSWRLKQRQLPALIFNATLGGAEYRAFWLAAAASGDYPAVPHSLVIAALEAIDSHARRWLAGDYRAHNRDFEILLSEVAGGDGGILLQALARQGDWLGTADQMLAQRMARGPLCAPGARLAARASLPHVIHKDFMDEIQLRATDLNRRYHEQLLPITALEEQLTTALPTAYRTWRSERNARTAIQVLASRRHRARLNAMQQPCMKYD